jgi:hypothetical protein
MRVLNLLALCMATCPPVLATVIESRDNYIPVLQPPPSDITLVYPDADVYPSCPIQLGVKIDIQQAGGMRISQQVNLIHPNNTSQVLAQGEGIALHGWYFYPQLTQCTAPRSQFGENGSPTGVSEIARSVYYFDVKTTGT